jgi:hypothetical protein
MTIECEAPRPQGETSRARSGEQKASKGNFILIVPLYPAYKAGLRGHLPVKVQNVKFSNLSFGFHLIFGLCNLTFPIRPFPVVYRPWPLNPKTLITFDIPTPLSAFVLTKVA